MPPGCKHQSAAGRRAFLKATASIGAALAAHPLFTSAAHASVPVEGGGSPRESFKIGVVLPESQLYPALGTSLLAGLKLAFAKRGNLVGDQQVELLPAIYNDRV